jgi:hypothetical protein
MGTSILITLLVILIGEIIAVIPRMRRIFAILLPIIFPRTKSALPLKAALILIASSGAPVAKATTVKPIISGDTPHFSPNRSTAFKKSSAPAMSPTRPKINCIIIIKIVSNYTFMVTFTSKK